MGFISDLSKKSIPQATKQIPAADARRVWRDIFSGISKEDPIKNDQKPHPGGSFGRSTVSTDVAYRRLLQAMRSMAPGGWSDDRWEQSRHFVGIQYVAIHRLSEQLAQSEFQVYRKDPRHPEGKVPVQADHPLVQLLAKPNKDDSFGDMLYQMNQQMDLTGMSLVWIVPNQLGLPYELYPIPTATAIPQPAVNPDYPDGYYRIQPVYPYGPFSSYPTPTSAVGAAIPAQWMMRVKYPHPLLRYEGYSPLTALRLHIDEIEAMDRSRWYSMKRSINPSAVLNFDEMEGAQPLPEEEIERIRAEFEASQMGPENTGQLYVATPGAKLEPWGARPVDMDYQSGWDQLVSFALGGFGITKPAAGMVDDSSYSTLYATLKQLYWLTLEPKVNRIAAKLTKFLAPFFGDDLIIEIRCRRIDDHDIQFSKIEKMMSAKAITKNEVRRELGYPLTSEEWGEEIAGTEPQPEMPGGMPGMPGGMPGAMPGMDGPAAQEEGEPINHNGVLLYDNEYREPDEVTETRPAAEKLAKDSLGPRKHLLNGHTHYRNGSIDFEMDILGKAMTLEDLNLVPSETMANNAKRGLKLRKKHKRGGTAVGVARARDIMNRKKLSPETVGRMFSFFSRHEVDKKGEGFNDPQKPSNGKIAWLLWGGDSGYAWAKSKWNAIQKIRNKSTSKD